MDLDKGDQQGTAPVPDKDDREVERREPTGLQSRDTLAKMAAAYMRESATVIRELPISERKPPQAGLVSARVVAIDDAHVAFAAATNSFLIVLSSSLDGNAAIGERLSLRFHQGRVSINNGRDRGR